MVKKVCAHERGLTKRAPDAGDSAAISSSFLRRFIFLAGRLRRPRPSAGNANRWALASGQQKTTITMMKEPSSIATKLLRWVGWAMKIFIAIPSLFALAGAFSSLQIIAIDFYTNMNELTMFNNWMVWLAALWFSFGWFTVNWFENALIDKKIKLAGAIAVFFFFALTSGIWLFEGLVNYGALWRFFNMSPQLFFSGAFLRFSMFHKETLQTYSKELFSLNRQA